MATYRNLLQGLAVIGFAATASAQMSDTCAGAAGTPLVAGPNLFDLTMPAATTDGMALDIMVCDMGSFGDEQIHQDNWGVFVAGSTDLHGFSTLGLAGFDTRLAIYDVTTCPDSPADVIACNDDEAVGAPFEAGLNVALTMGTSYLVRVGTYDATTVAMPAFLNITVIAPPPANDACAMPDPFVLGPNLYDTTNVTTDGTALDPLVCDLLSQNDIFDDIWGTFTAGSTELFNISTAGLAGYDTMIAVYSSTMCPDDVSTVIACNDDEGVGAPFEAGVTTMLTMGTTYLIRVGGFLPDTGAPGFVNIAAVGLPPANDDCGSPELIAMESPVGFPVSAVNASTDGLALDPMVCDMGAFGDDQIHQDIWFSFTPIVTKSYDVTTFNLAGYDTRLAVYDQAGMCPDDPALVIACNDDFSVAPFEAGLSVVLTAATEYTIRLGAFNAGTPAVPAMLLVGDAAGPPPPANDDCVNAELIDPVMAAAGLFIAVDTTFATDGTGLALDPVVCDISFINDDQIYQDVWYTLNPTVTMSYSVSSFNSGMFDSKLAVYEQAGCPDDPANVIACNDSTPGSAEASLVVALTAGTDYIIRYGTGTDFAFEAPGSIFVGPVGPGLVPPVNDDCANATALPAVFADTAYDGTNASTDGVDLNGFCDMGAFGDDNAYNDIWFTYTPAIGGCTYISTFNLAAADTRLAVYIGNNCPNDPSTILACADDEVLPPALPFEAGLDVTLSAGVTYLIRVGTYQPANGNGLGTLRIASGPVAVVLNAGNVNPGAPGCEAYMSLCSGDESVLGCATCPCTNPGPAGVIGGCAHSESATNGGFGARLIGSGSASIAGPFGSAVTTDLRFSAENLPSGATTVLFSGGGCLPNGNPLAMCFRQGLPAATKDGLRCASNSGGGLFRHGNRQANASGDIMDNTGPNRTWGGAAQPHGGLAYNPATNPGFVAGQTRFFDATYRDIVWGTCATGLNTTNAVRVTFTP